MAGAGRGRPGYQRRGGAPAARTFHGEGLAVQGRGVVIQDWCRVMPSRATPSCCDDGLGWNGTGRDGVPGGRAATRGRGQTGAVINKGSFTILNMHIYCERSCYFSPFYCVCGSNRTGNSEQRSGKGGVWEEKDGHADRQADGRAMTLCRRRYTGAPVCDLR